MEHNTDWVKGHIEIIAKFLATEMDVDVTSLPDYTNEIPEENREAFAKLRDQQMLVSKLMVPNKLIERVSPQGELYYAYFSPQTIKKLAHKFITEGYQSNWNIEHDPGQAVDGVTLVESWLVEDETHDKANVYGLKPKMGEWIGIVKIEDKALWNDYVKSGKVKGLSVEGYFADSLLEQPQQFVDPMIGESEDDYVARCVGVQMDEGKDLEQALAICYTTYKNR